MSFFLNFFIIWFLPVLYAAFYFSLHQQGCDNEAIFDFDKYIQHEYLQTWTALGHECDKGYAFDEFDESDEWYELMTLMADEWWAC